jgi:hypothetical protein
MRTDASPSTAPAVKASSSASGDGVYAYSTRNGVRYRFVFRQSDGTISSRRGFASRRAAATARRKLRESVDRGEVVVCREEFAAFWERFVRDKRPYVTAGSHLDLTAHGRKRLLPFFGEDQLSSIDSDRVREWHPVAEAAGHLAVASLPPLDPPVTRLVGGRTLAGMAFVFIKLPPRRRGRRRVAPARGEAGPCNVMLAVIGRGWADLSLCGSAKNCSQEGPDARSR